MNRILKFSGILSVEGDHIESEELKEIFTQAGVFIHIEVKDGLHTFKRTPESAEI